MCILSVSKFVPIFLYQLHIYSNDTLKSFVQYICCLYKSFLLI